MSSLKSNRDSCINGSNLQNGNPIMIKLLTSMVFHNKNQCHVIKPICIFTLLSTFTFSYLSFIFPVKLNSFLDVWLYSMHEGQYAIIQAHAYKHMVRLITYGLSQLTIPETSIQWRKPLPHMTQCLHDFEWKTHG